MADVRWKDKPQLAALAGTELLAGTSIDGGAKVGGGTIPPGADTPISTGLILAAAAAAAATAIATAVSAARAPVITSTITSGTITPSATTDILRALGLSADLTIANPSGSPADGAGFVAYIEDDGTTRALTWGSKYADSEFAALPAATTAGKRRRLGFEYHAGDDKLYCMYAEVEA